MTQVRFFTDEDVYGAIAIGLRKSHFDALSTTEAGRGGATDESQLQWASEEGRVLITFNVGHFADLHTRWIKQERHHSGVIVSAQRPIGETLRSLLHLANTLDGEAMADRLEFLGDW